MRWWKVVGKIRPAFGILFILAVPILAPLAGIGLAGRPVAPYLVFPPQPRQVTHTPFSWPVFLSLALFVILVCLPLFLRLVRYRDRDDSFPVPPVPFPWWGYCGLLLTGIAWWLAWHRFSWFAAGQPHTFLPLWLGYILTVNGLAVRRGGRSLLVAKPFFFMALFPASALFWWFFEYLNRFVANWHYLGVEDFGPLAYVLHASLSFSTVLPAVLGTMDFLATFPRLTGPLRQWRPVRPSCAVVCGRLTFIAACIGLGGIGIWPEFLFPLVWVAPLLIIVSLQAVRGLPTILAPLTRGDWRPVWLPALAAMTCGFFWEMWNAGSLAHWEYAVPLVQRWHLFEMPLLGYAGYLPFGLECIVVADLVAKPFRLNLLQGSKGTDSLASGKRGILA